MSRIDRHIQSLAGGFQAAGQIPPWPIHIATIFPYFGDLEAADLLSRLDRVVESNSAVISRLLGPPNVTKALLMDLIPGFKSLRPPVPRDRRVWFIETVFAALEPLQYGDLFNLDGRYLRMPPSESGKLLTSIPWIPWKADPHLGQMAYRISAAAQSLVWTLFFYGWTDIAFEIHGPYDLADAEGVPQQVIVRDFFDLKPLDLWPETRTFDHGRLRVLTIVDSSARTSIDTFNHLTTASSLHDHTRAFAIEVEGKVVSTVSAAQSVLRSLLAAVREQSARVRSLDQREVIYKFIESRYYAFRTWREFFGDDWRPPAQVRERLMKEEPQVVPSTGGPSTEELIRAFDPRDDYMF